MSLRNISIGQTFDVKFTTRQFSDGVPTTASGLTVVAYPGNSTTEITAGITTTFTSGFDARAGLVNVNVVATGGNGYADATDYALVISAGTVGGVSIVGEVIAEFHIGMDITGNLSGSVGSIASGGITDASFSATAGPMSALGITDQGTATAVGASSITLRAAFATTSNNDIVGSLVYVYSATNGKWQIRPITAWDNSTKVATVDAWTTALTGTVLYRVFAAPSAPTTLPTVNATQFGGAPVTATTSVTIPAASTLATTTGAVGSVTGAVGSVAGNTNQTGDTYALANGSAGFVAIDTVVDAVKVVTDALTSAAAAKLALSAAGIISGATTGTPGTTSTNTNLTGYLNDELIGGVIIFTGGTANGQRRTITDYVETNGVVSFAALITAPAASDTFVIV